MPISASRVQMHSNRIGVALSFLPVAAVVFDNVITIVDFQSEAGQIQWSFISNKYPQKI